MKTPILLVLLAAAAACSEHPREYRTHLIQPIRTNEAGPSSRIIGGQEAVAHSVPYQALLTVYGLISGVPSVWSCSGSVITHYYVLTSGRCVDGATQVFVTLGAHNASAIESTQINYEVEEIITHQNYSVGSQTIKYDISLLKLDSEIPYNNFIQPIALPTRDEIMDLETYVGLAARASGWGLTNDLTSVSDVLMYYEDHVIKNSECRETFIAVDDDILCTSGSTEVGICRGDVGGPLVGNFKLIGISSFWAIDCISGYPSGFTRITSYLDWININSDVVIS